MDQRIAQLRRTHAECPTDIHVHGALLRAALDSALIEREKVVFAALLGHEAAKLAVAECVRTHGIFYDGELISNTTIGDILHTKKCRHLLIKAAETLHTVLPEHRCNGTFLVSSWENHTEAQKRFLRWTFCCYIRASIDENELRRAWCAACAAELLGEWL